MKHLVITVTMTLILSLFVQTGQSKVMVAEDQQRRIMIDWQPFGTPYENWSILEEESISEICDLLRKSTLTGNDSMPTQTVFHVRPINLEGCIKASDISVYHNNNIVISYHNSRDAEVRTDNGDLYKYLLGLAKVHNPKMHEFFTAKGGFYDKKSCEKSGGEWQPEDAFTKANCVFQYSDAGKWCKNNGECFGRTCYKSMLIDSYRMYKIYDFLTISTGKCIEKTTGKRPCDWDVVDNRPRERNRQFPVPASLCEQR